MPENFDALAPAYDRYRIGYSNELYDSLFEFGVAPGARVLDVACGTGLVLGELDRRGCGVTGVDVSAPMLERARRRVMTATYVQAFAEALPFADSAFDAATFAQAFHWFDQPAVLEEMRRVVRPGGTIAIWWKHLMRGEPIRLHRDRAARAVGVVPAASSLGQAEFVAFDDARLEKRLLRIFPWSVSTTVGDWLGYERSRAIARNAYGDRLEAYFEALAALLGEPSRELALGYVQLLYLARVPA